MLSVIHEILAHHRQLESKWHTKKIKLHQRLALRLFQEDVNKEWGTAIYPLGIAEPNAIKKETYNTRNFANVY